MPNAIDQRLASLTHQARIRALSRVDSLARRVGLSYNHTGRDLLRLAAVPEADVARRIDAMTAEAFADIRAMIRTGFETEIRQTHKAIADAMIRSVPWRWFRKIHPMIVEAEEPVTGPMSKAEKRKIIERLLFAPPNADTVARLLNHSGPDGQGWHDRLRSWEEPIRKKMRIELIAGMFRGESVPLLRRRLEPLVGDIRYKAQRIARTEGRRMAELSQQDTYAGVGDMLDGMQVIASLDEHTRPEHAARHGKKYMQQADGTYVAEDGEVFPDLPDEPNCRCFASPILKTPAEVEKDPIVRAEFQTAQAATIPDPGAYRQWWATASEKEKRRSVGGRRFSVVARRLGSQGRVPEWEDFLDTNGHLMPISRLRRQTWKAWGNRRIKVEAMIAERERVMRQVAATGFDWPDFKTSPKPKRQQKPKRPEKVTEWRPAKTIREAARIARDLDLADVVDYRGMHVDVANDVNKSLAEHLRKFPKLRKNFGFIGTIQARNRYYVEYNAARRYAETGRYDLETWKKYYRKRIGRAKGSTYASAVSGGGDMEIIRGIAINEKWGTSPTRFREVLEADVQANWHPRHCGSIKSVIDHEIGHQIDALLGLTGRMRLRDHTFRAKLYVAGISFSIDRIEEGLSRYGCQNVQETLAEAWAEYNNAPEPRAMAKAIGKAIEETAAEKGLLKHDRT